MDQANPFPLPLDQEFDVILADPPWHFTSNSAAKPGRNARRHYNTMPCGDIAGLPVRQLAAKDSLLLIWTTAPHLQQAFNVVAAWGFKYVSQAVWVKDRIGTGYWVRGQHEPVLICKRGRFPCAKPSLFPSSVFHAPRREHSRKPPHVHERIEASYPQARKLELFARQPRDGWTVWGNQTDKFKEEIAS